jgi:hypothetical protein
VLPVRRRWRRGHKIAPHAYLFWYAYTSFQSLKPADTAPAG